MSVSGHSPNRRFELIAGHVADEREEFAANIREGLGGHPKRLSSRFLYDATGSLIFEKICELPEYYLTRTERAILTARADEIVTELPSDVVLVELGSGSATKTRFLIEALLRRGKELLYVPIDVSRTMVEESADDLLRSYRHLRIKAVVGDYSEGVRYVEEHVDQPKCIAWLGSSLGNFDRPLACQFLTELAQSIAPADRVLIGIDLRKRAEVIEQAYNDAQGLTAQFNLNLLTRINREFKADFDPASFRFLANYRETAGRVDSHLISESEQTVQIADLDMTVSFTAGEGIHTESSHKYSVAEIDELAESCQLTSAGRWLDPDHRFSVNLFAPAAAS